MTQRSPARLFLVNQVVTDSDWVRLLDMTDQSDAVMLVEDGVYSLQHPSEPSINHQSRLLVMKPDCERRGVKTVELAGLANIEIVESYHQLAELLVEYERCISWSSELC